MTVPAARLHARVQAMRSRLAVQRWKVRQRKHAAGSWSRFERLLALTWRAWTLSNRDVAALIASGREMQPAGLEFEPPRRLFFVRIDEIAALEDAREIALHASTELLLAESLALVPFDDIDPHGGQAVLPVHTR